MLTAGNNEKKLTIACGEADKYLGQMCETFVSELAHVFNQQHTDTKAVRWLHKINRIRDSLNQNYYSNVGKENEWHLF